MNMNFGENVIQFFIYFFFSVMQQMCSAIKGTGRKMDPNIKVGLQWLCGVLDQVYEKLKLRVDKDVEELERLRQIEKEERKERVRKQREERCV